MSLACQCIKIPYPYPLPFFSGTDAPLENPSLATAAVPSIPPREIHTASLQGYTRATAPGNNVLGQRLLPGVTGAVTFRREGGFDAPGGATWTPPAQKAAPPSEWALEAPATTRESAVLYSSLRDTGQDASTVRHGAASLGASRACVDLPPSDEASSSAAHDAAGAVHAAGDGRRIIIDRGIFCESGEWGYSATPPTEAGVITPQGQPAHKSSSGDAAGPSLTTAQGISANMPSTGNDAGEQDPASARGSGKSPVNPHGAGPLRGGGGDGDRAGVAAAGAPPRDGSSPQTSDNQQPHSRHMLPGFSPQPVPI